jgi:lipopolysaccharide export system permease protein
MGRSWIIDRYVARLTIAYLLLVAIFLTGALTAQQAGRLLEALSSTDAPSSAFVSIIAALLPTLLTLAIPMSVLLAVIIGLSQLGSDSEIVALQAAGRGAWALARPILIIGAAISLLAFYLNLVVSPGAARTLREIGLRAAKYKLESPVEPRSFNTDIPDHVLHIREGDKKNGAWHQVFIYRQQPDGSIRIITASEGRIDFAKEEQTAGSELFLRDAVMLSSAPATEEAKNAGWTIDRAGQTRLTFPTTRQEVLQRLQQRPFELDELSLGELRAIAAGPSGPEQRTAAVLAQKKLALSIGPLVMSLLGVSLGVRVRRGGRGAGLVLGLAALIAYQLVALIFEQMARKGSLHPVPGVWMGPGLAILFSLVWLTSRNTRFALRGWQTRWLPARAGATAGPEKDAAAGTTESFQPAQPTGHSVRFRFPAFLDWSAARSLTLLFLLTLAALTLLFLTFTMFELWRFLTPTAEGYSLMGKYLFYLLPLTLTQTLPAAGMIAALATYALMVRRLETVAWWSSGLSAYRVMLPGILFVLALGGGFWLLQELVMPRANLTQDALRATIKGSPRVTTPNRQWLAPSDSATLYSYAYDETSDTLNNLTVFEFRPDQTHLSKIIRAQKAAWQGPRTLELSGVDEIGLSGGVAVAEKRSSLVLQVAAERSVFKPAGDKPSQMSAAELSSYVNAARSRGEPIAGLSTALQAKYAAPFAAIALMALGAPLALVFDRRRLLNALGAAVLASLLFWIMNNFFQQLGIRGLLPPIAAAWIPTAIFASLTFYLYSQTRT